MLDHLGFGMHRQHFLVQGICWVFCGADEDTGKTMVDTCDLTGSQICFHGMIGRYQRNTSLLSDRKIKSDCHLTSGKKPSFDVFNFFSDLFI